MSIIIRSSKRFSNCKPKGRPSPQVPWKRPNAGTVGSPERPNAGTDLQTRRFSWRESHSPRKCEFHANSNKGKTERRYRGKARRAAGPEECAKQKNYKAATFRLARPSRRQDPLDGKTLSTARPSRRQESLSPQHQKGACKAAECIANAKSKRKAQKKASCEKRHEGNPRKSKTEKRRDSSL
jgi:hypothetical protein